LIRPSFIVWNTSKVHYMEKNPGMFSSKTLISFRLKKYMDILDDMGVSKLSASFFFK